ncbi:MAG: putative lipid II flippase FtsW [Syntrophales bacterium]
MSSFSEKKPDVILLLVTLCLVIVGTAMVYSSSSILAMERYNDGQYFIKKQIIFVFLGLGIMVLLTRFPYYHLRKLAYPGVLLSVFLLGMLLFSPMGVRAAGGARRWLSIFGFSFQVTEMVKVLVVMFLAHFLAKQADHLTEFKRGVMIPLLITSFIIGLIMLEPDFGTSVIVFSIFMLMLYLSGSRILHIAGIAAVFAPVGLWLLVQKDYRMDRLKGFWDPWKDPLHSGFHIIQSLLSFGSGGAFGVGVGDGMQKLFYLPEPHTDFILAVIAEEMGFIGVAVVIFLFTVFIFRGFLISFNAPDLFGTLLAAGLTMIIALEAIINIAGVMGLIPVKGLALPFISYGGTSLIMSLSAVGILLSISSQVGTGTQRRKGTKKF